MEIDNNTIRHLATYAKLNIDAKNYINYIDFLNNLLILAAPLQEIDIINLEPYINSCTPTNIHHLTKLSEQACPQINDADYNPLEDIG